MVRKTVGIFVRNPSPVFRSILFDILFIAVLFTIIKFVSSYVVNIAGVKAMIETSSILALFVLAMLGFYLFIFMLIYAFFKYCLLDFIESFTAETKFSFRHLPDFYILNIKIFVLFFLLFVFINIILFFTTGAYFEWYAFFALVAYVFVFYTMVNVGHTMFISDKHIYLLGIMKISAKKNVFLYSLFSYLLFVLLYAIYNLLAFYDSPLFSAYTVLMLALFYFIVQFNRLHYYLLLKEALVWH